MQRNKRKFNKDCGDIPADGDSNDDMNVRVNADKSYSMNKNPGIKVSMDRRVKKGLGNTSDCGQNMKRAPGHEADRRRNINRNLNNNTGNVSNDRHSYMGPTHNGNRGRYRNRPPRIFPIGEAALQGLLTQDSFIIARKLIDERSGYAILISEELIPPNKFDLVIQILNLALQCKTDREATLQLLLLTFQKSQFVNQLCCYTSSLKCNMVKTREFLPYIVKIIENYVRYAPSDAFLKVSSLTDLCGVLLQQLKNENPGEFKDLEVILPSIQSQLQESQTRWSNNQKRGISRLEKLDSVLPPENFNKLNVAPSCFDLMQTRAPFLRRNVIDGPYVDSQHYLDVHFRLMREDFVRPLREGLQHHLRNSNDKNHDVRIYKNVYYKGSQIEEKGLVFYVELNLQKNFDPNKSKRFMFGNILCLSFDNFQTMIIASVCNRDSLHNRLLGMQYECSGKGYDFLDITQTYTMIESKAYFGAYVHTLKALQKLDIVPLENFIVKLEDSNSPPRYLERSATYDLSAVGLQKRSSRLLHNLFGADRLKSKISELESVISNLELVGSDGKPDGHDCLDVAVGTISESDLSNLPVETDSTHLKKNVRLLDGLNNWPSCDALNLDESQRMALHGALTRQLAIIQGPPGTGKTHVGLEIAKVLLFNKDSWKGAKGSKSCPILVVCYTNHALDQFLEGISQFTRSIIRVGSRCKNEALMEYNISNILKQRDYVSDVGRTLSSGFYDAQSKLRMCKDVLHDINTLIDALSNSLGIIHYDVFMKFDIFPVPLQKHLWSETLKNFLVYGNLTNNRVYTDQDRKLDFNFVMYSGFNNQESKESVVTEEKKQTFPANKDVDQEIFDDEQNARILDDGYSLQYNDEDKPITEYSKLNYFELLEEVHVKEIRSQQNELNHRENSYYRRDCIKYFERITVLKSELKIIREGLTIRGSAQEVAVLENVKNIRNISLPQRWKLYNSWKEKLIAKLQQEKRKHEMQYLKAARNLESLRSVEYLSKMREVDVVGMTTTGAAQHCDIVHDLAPPIVIVEEAAEILEAHVISSLSENCQQLILIGDHQQLQPNPSVYSLAVHYNLNVSLFERLIKNGISYTRLKYQHRMKPCISNLLVPTIYKDLHDHPSVFTYPKIRGLEKDLFFFDHTHLETKHADDNESVENPFEAELALALCRHLLFQGYSVDDITILSPYSGQHRLIKELQRDYPHCKDVRVSILDNYQGEENNIIILCLVRSNEDGKVGFVKSDNRVCVALSRAKQGFYMIGNMTQFAEACPLWSQLKQKLVDGGNLGPQITLVCGNHPNEEDFMKITCAQDFILLSPEGGCTRKCEAMLPNCNHSCPRTCHVFDPDHLTVHCNLPCPKTICKLDHPCPDLCYQQCAPCGVLLEKVLPCGHTHQLKCCLKPEDFNCQTMVVRELNCKHEAQMKCYEKIEYYVCKTDCDTRLDCGHKCNNKCHINKDPEHDSYVCREKCDRIPENCQLSHACEKFCYENCGPCREIINRNLPCGHTMSKVPCGAQIKCLNACRKKLDCGHPCPKICWQPCGGCKVKVKKTIPECEHSIEMECGLEANSKYCTANCKKLLDCGHRCIRKCRDSCSKTCMKLVESQNICPRGHNIKLPCWKVKSTTVAVHIENKPELNIDDDLWQLCKEYCKMPLECGHICPGKCGECFNGRFHTKCEEKCNKALVCGHICVAPCSDKCPPCQSKCELKCNHSKCKKNCGVPCVNCKYWCERGCEHSRCGQKCGKPCNYVCEQSCPKKLKCGHSCVGFCGERCPRRCRVCNKEEVESIFFGEEDNCDAKFIVLEDCGHEFESNGLNAWMNTVSEEIGMKKCPTCRKPIYNTKRFQSCILNAFEDVKKVKQKYYTMKSTINRSNFISDLIRLQPLWPSEVREMLHVLGYCNDFRKKIKYRQISDMELGLLDFQLDFLKLATNIKANLNANKYPREPASSVITVTQRNFKLHTRVVDRTSEESIKLQTLTKQIFRLHTGVSDQTREEAICEVRRISVISSVLELSKSTDETVQKIVKNIKIKLSPATKFTSDLEKEVVIYLEEAQKVVKNLNLILQERKMIVKAMGFKQGHWYKCPNGHIYCIADCGGANEIAKCSECRATIGGTQHRLYAGNQVATEMDGATRPAWPGGY